MKINKIYINAFGKLKDYTLEFYDGFNVIYGENENGKTTIMNFIKMMFYGSGKRGQSISSNYRSKYLPWSGDTMGGKIYFEHSDISYCLEREFRKSDSTDRVILTNLSTGETDNVASDVGASFFDMSLSAFERCMFIEECSFSEKDTDADGELNSKLSNLVLTGNDGTSYHTVISRIENARNKIVSKSGRTGSLTKLSAQLEELQNRLTNSENDHNRKFELQNTLLSLKEQYDKLNSDLENLENIVNQGKDIRNCEKLREYLCLKDSLEDTKKQLTLNDGSLADNLFIGNINFCLNKIQGFDSKISELNSEAERIEKELILSSDDKIEQTKLNLSKSVNAKKETEEKLESVKQLINEIKKQISDAEKSLLESSQQRKTINIFFLLPTIILLIIGTILLVFKITVISAISLIFGVLCLILSFAFRPKNKKALDSINSRIRELTHSVEKQQKEYEDLHIRIYSLNEQISLLSAAVESNTELRAQRQNDLDSKRNAINAETEKKTASEKDLETLVSRFPGNISVAKIKSQLELFSKKAEEIKTIKLKLNYLCNDLGGISYEEAKDKLSKLNSNNLSIDFETAEKEYKKLTVEKNELISKISSVATEVKSGFNSKENPQSIQKEIEILRQKVDSQKKFCDAADIACEVLNESLNEIRESYGAMLEEKTIKYLTQITDDQYSDIHITKAMDISFEKRNVFGTRDSAYLSKGTTDQMYLSLRIALSELISENSSMPIFMDDVLSQYDDLRMENAIEFLKEYSSKIQIILFTCHNNICQAAEEKGIICRDFYS